MAPETRSQGREGADAPPLTQKAGGVHQDASGERERGGLSGEAGMRKRNPGCVFRKITLTAPWAKARG